jgi:RNA polymerase sigma-70 factor (ECF subfamily)
MTMLARAHAKIGAVPVDKPHGEAVPAGVRPAGAAPIRLQSVPDGASRSEARAVDRPYAGLDDETLVSETLAGRRWAQREVWYRFAPMVHSLLRRTLSPRHDHDDLAQEVFLRVFRRLHTLEKPSALRSFVYSVGVRVVSEEIRRFQVLQRTRTQLASLGDESGNRGADFEARDILLKVQHILDGMKDKHRAVFVLRHVEGLDLREISDGLGISLATVKRYLVKAMVAIEKAALRDETLKVRLGIGPQSAGARP